MIMAIVLLNKPQKKKRLPVRHGRLVKFKIPIKRKS